jgi:hypothetical protein
LLVVPPPRDTHPVLLSEDAEAAYLADLEKTEAPPQEGYGFDDAEYARLLSEVWHPITPLIVPHRRAAQENAANVLYRTYLSVLLWTF